MNYLLEEFTYKVYSNIVGIDKSDCTLADATKSFLEIFEHPKNWKSKISDRTTYAQAILDAFKGVGIDGQNTTN